MNTSPTSIDSYNRLEGLGRKQIAVFGFVRRYGPISRRKLAERMGWTINRITGRVAELMDMGLIRERGQEWDEETKRFVHLLEVIKL